MSENVFVYKGVHMWEPKEIMFVGTNYLIKNRIKKLLNKDAIVFPNIHTEFKWGASYTFLFS